MIDYYTNVCTLGNNLCVRGIRNGKEVMDKIPYEPVLYIETDKDYGFSSIYGTKLKPIKFDTMREATEFGKEHANSNLKLYGMPFYAHQYIIENFIDTADKWNKEDIRIFNIDIEVTSTEGFPKPEDAEFPVTAVCIHDSKADKFVVFGDNKWEKEKSELGDDILEKVVYIQCRDEQDLFSKMLRYWQSFPPNIITGWNVELFDIPYLMNRALRLGIDIRRFSPWSFTRDRMLKTSHGEEQIYTIYGVDTIDYLQRYRKNKVQQSYRLDYIAEIELGERKLDYSEVQGLHNLYFENYQKFIDYNIQDVNLVKRLDEKMGLIDADIMIAYEACMNYNDVSSPVRTWDFLINKELHKQNKKVKFHTDKSVEYSSIPGGFVKEPQVGKHGWCMSFDLNSLYPHLIMQFNISPETLLDGWQLWPTESKEGRVKKMLNEEPLGDVPKNHSITAAGHAFSNEFEGIIPKLMSKMYRDRKAFKKQMLEKQRNGEDDSLENLRQLVMKLLLNSGYGALINKYFRWFDVRMGESITLSGQFLIQVAERELNKWMNKVVGTTGVDYIIAIDTDSNYISCQALVDKFFPDKSREEVIDILDKIANEQIEKVLENGFEEAKNYLHAYEQKMVMEREAIASNAFWTAKKRYAMCVWDMEGVRMPPEKPKIKIQGLEAIRSSTPHFCRGALLDLIKKTLLEDEEDVQKFVLDFKNKFMEAPYQEIAMPRSMNLLKKYAVGDTFRKGCPPHVRGAIRFNHMLKVMKLENTWEEVKEGEKGKFLYLREPNRFGCDTISFVTSIPDDFEIDKYIDREKMFEKVVLDAADNIFQPLGWSVEKQQTLEDFFG